MLMLTYVSENLATIIISTLLMAVVVWIIIGLMKKKKRGKYAACGCSCSGCPGAVYCYDQKENSTE